jgi:membrane associated rhomboid family serine protease
MENIVVSQFFNGANGTFLIIVANTIIFFASIFQPTLLNYSLVPAKSAFSPLSNFLHINLVHLLSNMWTLNDFGPNVETKLGTTVYLLFYLFAGVVVDFIYALFRSTSLTPTLGASGAVSAILGYHFGAFQFESSNLLNFIIGQLLSFGISGESTGVSFLSHIIGFCLGYAFSVVTKN